MRFYFTQLRGNGASPAYYCPLADTQATAFDFLDGREYPEIEDGWLFAWTNNTDLEHAQALLQADIQYIPLETAGGVPVELLGLVGDVSAANRTSTINLLNFHGIPTGNITLSTPVGDAMRDVVKRIRILEQLRYVDLITSDVLGDNDVSLQLGYTISTIGAKRKKAMNRRLTNLGFDLAGITNTTTLGDAMLGLVSQNVLKPNMVPF